MDSKCLHKTSQVTGPGYGQSESKGVRMSTFTFISTIVLFCLFGLGFLSIEVCGVIEHWRGSIGGCELEAKLRYLGKTCQHVY